MDEGLEMNEWWRRDAHLYFVNRAAASSISGTARNEQP